MKDPWGIFPTRDWTRVSCIAGRSFTVWATREAFALESSAFILWSPLTDWMRPTLMKLKLQYFCHLMRRTDSLEKTLMPGKIEVRERERQGMRWWMVSPTWWMWVWASSRSWWWTGKLDVLQSTGLQRVGHDWVTEVKWIVGKLFKYYIAVVLNLLNVYFILGLWNVFGSVKTSVW